MCKKCDITSVNRYLDDFYRRARKQGLSSEGYPDLREIVAEWNKSVHDNEDFSLMNLKNVRQLKNFYTHQQQLDLIMKERKGCGGPTHVADISDREERYVTGVVEIPPQLGEKLLYLFLSRDERECLIGDLQEEYNEVRARHGARFARLFYWKQVVTSLAPIIRRWVLKWVGIGTLTTAAEWVQRQFGL